VRRFASQYETDMQRFTRSGLIALVAIVFTLTMAASGFAHRPGAALAEMQLAPYLAAGGNLSELCQGVGGHGPVAGKPCDACRLIGAAVMPEPTALRPLEFPRALAGAPNGCDVSRIAFARDPARGVRAPPFA
jgi:hypothetical protein